MQKIRLNWLLLIFFIINVEILSQNPEWIFYDTTNSPLPTNNILDIRIDRFNNKWISTSFDGMNGYQGLIRIQGEEWTIFNTANSGIPSNIVTTIDIDNNGILWIGTPNGLSRFDGENWILYNTANSALPYDHIRTVLVESDTSRWIISYLWNQEAILLKLVGDSTWIDYGPIEAHTGGIGEKLLALDSLGNLWYTYEFYLAKFDGSSWTYYQPCYCGAYPSEINISITQDVWIAAGSAGWGKLCRFDGNNFHYYNYQAVSVIADSLNNIWVGTETLDYPDSSGSLLKYDGISWTTYNYLNSPMPITDRIWAIEVDLFDNIWLGLWEKGIAIFNEGGIVVPVELLFFQGKLKEQQVELSWQTVTETNNSGFAVERSTVNTSFAQIGFVQGNGTTTEVSSYNYNDESVQTGTYYYRLKQIDFDGTFDYSNTIEVDLSVPTAFSLQQNYPNPFNPSTKISFSLPVDSKVTIALYNSLGQEVRELVTNNFAAGNHQIDFNASELSSGIYLYTINAIGADGSMFKSTMKMMLMK